MITKENFLDCLEEFSIKLVDYDEFDEHEFIEFQKDLSYIKKIYLSEQDQVNALSLLFDDIINSSFDQIGESLFESLINEIERTKKKIEKGYLKLEYKSENIQEKSNISVIAPDSFEEKSVIDDDKELFDDYVMEMFEFLESIEQQLIDVEKKYSPEKINNIFRLYHGLKGNAGVMKHVNLSIIAHTAEDILEKIRTDNIKLSPAIFDVLFKINDLLKNSINNLDYTDPRNDNIPENLKSKILSEIEILLYNEEKKTDTTNVTEAEQASEMQLEKEKEKTKTSSIRVTTQKLDSLINLVGELVISSNSLKQDEVVNEKRNFNLSKKVSQLNRIVGDLQETSLSLRMVPISNTFQKLRRIVRDYSKKSLKKIDFIEQGENTEIDRNLVDELYEPLSHIIRNACDHGIESSEERKRRGKNEVGNIHINAYHKGNSFIIDVKDDGKGISSEKVYQKAIDLNLVKSGSVLSQNQKIRLILLPGFSTARQITNVSGRGVGMDVVNQSLKKMGGFIEIASIPEKGTNFRISLPLTLGIIEGMLIGSSSKKFIIPIININRTLNPLVDDLNSITGKQEMLKTEDGIIPIIRLDKIYNLSDEKKNLENMIIIIINANQGRFALAVDQLFGIQDVVVKTLGSKFESLKSISGATILGNGEIALILDINHIIDHITRK